MLVAWAIIGCGGEDSVEDGPSVEPEIVRFELVISERGVEGGERTLRVVEGQQVDLAWSADEPVTLHVHGYDLELELEPGSPRVQSFVANATGRFPVTAHGFEQAASDGHAHTHESDHGASEDEAAEPTLVYLEVHPR